GQFAANAEAYPDAAPPGHQWRTDRHCFLYAARQAAISVWEAHPAWPNVSLAETHVWISHIWDYFRNLEIRKAPDPESGLAWVKAVEQAARNLVQPTKEPNASPTGANEAEPAAAPGDEKEPGADAA